MTPVCAAIAAFDGTSINTHALSAMSDSKTARSFLNVACLLSPITSPYAEPETTLSLM